MDVAPQIEYGHRDEEIENILIHNQQQDLEEKMQCKTQPVNEYEDDEANDMDDFVISSQTSHL